MSDKTFPEKKKRRSIFFEKSLCQPKNETFVLDDYTKNPTLHPGEKITTQEKQYIEKLKKEKKEWIKYKEQLTETYNTQKNDSTGESLNPTDYMKYLSDDDIEFMEKLDKASEDYKNLKNIKIPKLINCLTAMQCEFKRHLELEELLYRKCEISSKLLYNFYFNTNKDEFEILASKLRSLNEDSTIFDDPFLIVEEN